MTEQEFIALAAARYKQITELNRHENLYDYEKEFEQIWLELGRETFEKSLGPLPEERRKKKDPHPVRRDRSGPHKPPL